MTVRRLKPKQRGPWCDFCEPKTTRAVHRDTCFRKFACSEHLPDLEAEDREETRRDAYQTEAEWMLGV